MFFEKRNANGMLRASCRRAASVTQHGAIGGNAVAEKRVDLAYDSNGQIQSINRYLGQQLAVQSDFMHDTLGRLTVSVR